MRLWLRKPQNRWQLPCDKRSKSSKLGLSTSALGQNYCPPGLTGLQHETCLLTGCRKYGHACRKYRPSLDVATYPYSVSSASFRQYGTTAASRDLPDGTESGTQHLLPIPLKHDYPRNSGVRTGRVDPFTLRMLRCTNERGEEMDGLVIELGHMLNPTTLSRQIKFFLDSRPERALLFNCKAPVVPSELKRWAAHLDLEQQVVTSIIDNRALPALLKPSKVFTADTNVLDLSIIKAGSYLVQLSENILQNADLTRGLGRAQLAALWLNHWHILMFACKGYAAALPDLILTPTSDSFEHGRHEVSTTYDFSMKNRHFDIEIPKSGVFESKFGGARIFLEALIEYCTAISYKLKQVSLKEPLAFSNDVMPPTEFVQRATKALDLGDLMINSHPKDIPLAWSNEALWTSHVSLSRVHDDIASATWPHRRHAHALATMKAAACLKLRIEQAWSEAHLTSASYSDLARLWKDDATIQQLSRTHDSNKGKSRVFSILLSDSILQTMLKTLRNLSSSFFPSSFKWTSVDTTCERSDLKPRRWPRISKLDNMLRNNLTDRTSSPDFTDIRRQQDLLPLRQSGYSERVVRAVADNDVVVITAATGSGKTTQIPQILYDDAANAGRGSLCNIVCTQPRRIATTSVARRVAAERLEPLGKGVGFRVRFQDRSPKLQNAITFMTSGMLLRLIESDPEQYLSQFSHIILDEIHVRDLDSDLLLAIVNDHLSLPVSATRWRPKIILMSATIESSLLMNFVHRFNKSAKVAHLHIPGKTYPVKSKFLDQVITDLEARDPPVMLSLAQNADTTEYLNLQRQIVNDPTSREELSNPRHVSWFTLDRIPIALIVAVIVNTAKISSDSDILVFLPGLGEIEAIERELLENPARNATFGNSRKFRIFKLHSSLYDTNYDVFAPVPPGCRRLVLATNIAETSLTIPNVVYVIDSGLCRQSVYNQVEESARFGLTWISKAEVQQRRGRCGRRSPGHYIALFSKQQYQSMRDECYPEILRTNLASLVLRIQESKAYQLPGLEPEAVDGKSTALTKASNFLRRTLSAPRTEDVEAATQQLRELRALDEDNRVTALGRVISAMPVDPSRSKAAILGVLFRCLDPLLVMAALTQDLPIVHDPLKKGAVLEVRKRFSGGLDDDLLADTKIFMEYARSSKLGDVGKLSYLKQALFVRPASVGETARIVHQISDKLSQLYTSDTQAGVGSVEPGAQADLSPSTAAWLNENSSNEVLLKALAFSTAGSRVARWRLRNWYTARYARVLPRPHSVNYTRGSKDARTANTRREAGDLCSYRNLRKTPDTAHPWIEETSIVSPLIGMLFGQSLRLEGSVLVVNDFVKYKIECADFKDSNAARVIFEFRKALDRFIGLAFQNMNDRTYGKPDDGRNFFAQHGQPFREIFLGSIIKMLEIDTHDRAKRAQARLDEVEEEAKAVRGDTEAGSSSDKPQLDEKSTALQTDDDNGVEQDEEEGEEEEEEDDDDEEEEEAIRRVDG